MRHAIRSFLIATRCSMFTLALVASSLLAFARNTDASETLIKLTSLEWPPYTSAKLPEQGYTTALLRAAFAQVGYRVEVEFYPWSRAVLLAKQGGEYAGYFPEYFSHAIAANCILSDSLGDSPLGLAFHPAQPFEWRTYDDLKLHTIGVVQDYVNTEPFDRNVANGSQAVEMVSTDWQNIKKLGAHHLRAAIIDANVLRFLVHNQAPQYQAIKMHPQLLENKKLYVCFSKNAANEHHNQLLHDGLQKIDRNALLKSFPFFRAPTTIP